MNETNEETFNDIDPAILESLQEMERGGAYRHYKPLTEAANEFIRWAETPELRVYTGIPELDRAMRGTAPGELTLIQGFTHSGKTLVATDIMINNPDVPMILFTPDETRPLVLTKLTSALHEVNARELEKRIQADDDTARQLLMETAERHSKLAIFDESVSIMDMDRMFEEVCDAFKTAVRAVIFDYADLLVGHDDVRNAITSLKAWGKRNQVAMFLLHQTSRGAGSSGRKIGIDSGSMGGEMQATHVIGVRRKKYMHIAMLAALEEKIANATNENSIALYQSKMREIKDFLMPKDENTVTVNLVKNKRPPCDLIDDLDMVVDVGTGRLKRIEQHQDKDGRVTLTKKSSLTYVRDNPQWSQEEAF